jgi:hypothetical protein
MAADKILEYELRVAAIGNGANTHENQTLAVIRGYLRAVFRGHLRFQL